MCLHHIIAPTHSGEMNMRSGVALQLMELDVYDMHREDVHAQNVEVGT